MTHNKNTLKKYFLLFILTCLSSSLLAEDRYIRDNTKEVVLDTYTKLMWEDDISTSNSNNKLNWQDALGHCSSSSLGGYTNWVLPNLNEFYSIADTSKFNPTLDTVFTNISASYYWSSTSYAQNSSNAWVMAFYNGNNYFADKSKSYYVRCVRIND